ncbi:MAG: hypothetical protein IPK08_11240 [Bacteroidetes bacterium]|nr:hypothetical protein [Bacteroidota bacterium]
MISCSDTNEELFGESVLTGRTFYTNELTGSGVKTVKKEVTLKLAYTGTSTGTDYDATVTSNDDGYFVFNNISNCGEIRIFGEFEEDGISFKLNTTFTNRPTTLDLNFVYDPDYYNGIRIRSSDASGSPVPEMNYYVYNNQTAFTANDTSNAILKKQLNQYGIALLNDLQQGTYYVVLQGMINNINYSGTGSIQFNGTDVADLNIQVTALVQPGLTLIVQDPNGFVVSGVKVCLFTSGIIFSGAESCDGSVDSGISDNNGKIKFPGISPMQYFVLCKDTISSIPLYAQDTVTVTPGTAIEEFIVVQ